MGLPFDWYYEWIILGVIGYSAYLIAYDKVGSLYHGDFISGRAAGSFFHWIIVVVAIAVKVFIWIKERNKLVKVSVKVENNNNR